MSMPTKVGAPAAYRGYRLQALYTLDLMLGTLSDEEITIRPEGKEDIDVLVKGVLHTAIQVKSYPDLVLSNLDPGNPRAFLRRSIKLLQEHPNIAIELINFGDIGHELTTSWKPGPKCPKPFKSKLSEHGFKASEIKLLVSRISIGSVREAEVYTRVHKKLGEALTGIDPDAAFELLTFWLYSLAEQQRAVATSELLARIRGIGKFLAERYAHINEWHTSILPLNEVEIDPTRLTRLREEFYEGTSANTDHISANLDVRRPAWINAIAESFIRDDVTVVHAASGQGKTTLALRYICDHFPPECSFAVSCITDRKHAAQMALALSGHANATGLTIVIHIDVSPRDRDWTDLVQLLSRVPRFKILVTIREEDFQQAEVIARGFRFSEVSLALNKEEAAEIFSAIHRNHDGPRRFNTFDEAWESFGGDGPLLEFVYLLTKTESLRNRLSSQVYRLRREIRERNRHPDELRVLQIAAVATAYEGRIDILLLSKAVPLPDIVGTLSQFENEYLIRRSSDDKYLEALHPVRSAILADLLCDTTITRWADVAMQCLNLIQEIDIGGFLLRGLLEHETDQELLLGSVRQMHFQRWAGFAGALRAYRWALTRADIADSSETSLKTEQNLKNPGPRLRTGLNDWIGASAAHIPSAPTSVDDWRGLAYSWFSLVQLNIKDSRFVRIDDAVMEEAVQGLSLFLLSELSMALYLAIPGRHKLWWKKFRGRIIERLCREYGIFALVEDAGKVIIHYIFNEGEREGKDEQNRHEATLERIQLIRHFIPTFESYGTEAYWHSLGDAAPLAIDDTRKTGIPVRMLPPSEQMRSNRISTNLRIYRSRPGSWSDFVSPILDRRQKTVEVLERLVTTLSECSVTDAKLLTVSNSVLWVSCRDSLRHATLLPKTAVDPWGFASEQGTRETYLKTNGSQPDLIGSLSGERYKDLLKIEQTYFNHITGFLDHFQAGLITHSTRDTSVTERERSLSFGSLVGASDELEKFQTSFRLRLGEMCDASEIETLEQRERLAFRSLLVVWLFRSKRSAISVADMNVELSSFQDEFIHTIEKSLESAGIRGTTRPDLKTWQGEPALWIFAEVEDPRRLLNLAQCVLDSIHDGLAPHRGTAIFDHVTSHIFTHLVILPTYRGKAFSRSAFRFLMRSIFWQNIDLNTPEHAWKQISLPIDADLWSNIGTETWAEFSPFDGVFKSVGALWAHMAMISTLERSPQAEPEAQAIISEIVSNALDKRAGLEAAVVASISQFVDEVKNLDEASLHLRQAWSEVMSNWNQFSELLRFGDAEGDGRVTVKISEIYEYTRRLQRAVGIAMQMRLWWIIDLP